MLSDRLKNETQVPHLDLEKLVIPKIKRVKDAASYAELLRLFYGYFKPTEQLVDQYVSNDQLDDYDDRRKATVIKEDLKFIGVEQLAVAVCNDLPSVNSLTEALGVMYVLEGSTLGGKFISKMLINQLQLEGNDGVQFFSGYGDATEEKWMAFRHYLNNFSHKQEDHDKVVAAANDTFLKFKRWVEAN